MSELMHHPQRFQEETGCGGAFDEDGEVLGTRQLKMEMWNMKLAVGLWDHLFGKEIPFEIPGPVDKLKKRKATIKWISRKQHEQQLEHLGDAARVHMLDAKNGYTILHWNVGEDIDAEAVEKFRDSETGDFYAVTHYEDGEEQTHLMTRPVWEEARRQTDAA